VNRNIFSGNPDRILFIKPSENLIPIDGEIPEDMAKALNNYTRNRSKENFLTWVETAFKYKSKREETMAKGILQHQEGGVALIGMHHLNEVAGKLKAEGAEVITFASAGQTAITRSTEFETAIIESMQESKKTPAVKSKAKDLEELRNISQIAILPLDKELALHLKFNPQLLMVSTKKWLEDINKAIGDSNVEQDMEQIKEKFKNLAEQIEAQTKQQVPARR